MDKVASLREVDEEWTYWDMLCAEACADVIREANEATDDSS